jgi:hypothetical protein
MMRVGDLIKVKPAEDNLALVVGLDGYDIHTGDPLPDCVMITVFDTEMFTIAMHPKWINVISKNNT